MSRFEIDYAPKIANINRIYPLTGLLKFKDGTNFHGASAWKNDYKHSYYQNKKNDIRIVADLVEVEARKIVSEIINGSVKVKEALSKYKNNCSSTSILLESHQDKIRNSIEQLKSEKVRLDKRLDFLLEDGDELAAKRFRKQYLENMKRLDKQLSGYNEQLRQIDDKRAKTEGTEFDWKKIGEKSQRILEQIDPVALKNAYRSLFECIVVGDLDKTELKFVLKGEDFEFEPSVNQRKKIRDGVKMAPQCSLRTNFVLYSKNHNDFRV